MRNQGKNRTARAYRSFAALVMILCLLTGMIPAGFAAKSVGDSSDYVEPSQTKTYIQISNGVKFFTGETSGTGTVISPDAGVYQLVSTDWYTAADGTACPGSRA